MKKDISKLYIDIGAWGIKVVEAVVYHGDVTVTNYAMIKTPPDVFEDCFIRDTKALAGVLENGLRSYGFKSKTAVLTLACTGILTRELILPKSSYKDLALMVNMELPNHFPVDISQYSVSFKVLEEIGELGSSQYRVMVLMTPLKALRGYMEMFNFCGIYLEKIDYNSNSITKLLAQHDMYPKTDNQETYAVIDIGYASSNITICKNGVLRYGRSFPYGSSHYNRELIDITGLSSEQAEEVKRETGIYTGQSGGFMENAARQAWAKLSVPLFDEVIRVFDFFTSRGEDNSIDRILITGGSSMMPNLIEQMSSSFDIKIGFLSCEDIAIYQNEGINMKWFSSYFANCMGAIFEEQRALK